MLVESWFPTRVKESQLSTTGIFGLGARKMDRSAKKLIPESDSDAMTCCTVQAQPT